MGEYKNASPEIREVNCLRVLYPQTLKDMRVYDIFAGHCAEVNTSGEINEFDTFEKLYGAFLKQLDAHLEIEAKVHRHNKEVTKNEAAFVMISLLMNDCIEKGRGIFDMGGLRLNINCFSGGVLEKAVENPKDYGSIIVRVSGYSARFIDLDRITQKHIMERTP